VEHPAEQGPVVLPLPAPAGARGWGVGGKDRPLAVGEVAAVQRESEAQPPSSDSADRA
jgi:hypothetical protein